jgi:DNA polymerase-1
MPMAKQMVQSTPPSENPSEEFLKDAIFLVDASSYIFRAYYAIRSGLTSPSGVPTHATFGFLQMVLALCEIYRPKKLIFVWDTPAKGVRNELFKEYKANRSVPPEDLGLQIQNSQKALELLGVHQVSKEGFEADDVIATLIEKHPEEKFVVVTGDKDLLQLVTDRVWCLDTMKNKWSNILSTFEKFGVGPSQVPWVQALSGDSVDNIPGAPGIGPKTATELIQHYGSLDAVLRRAQELALSNSSLKSEPLKGKRIEAIAENVELVELSLKLVSLIRDVPLPHVWDDIKSLQAGPDLQKAEGFFAELGLMKIWTKSKSIFSNSMDQKTISDQRVGQPFAFECRLISTLKELSDLKSEILSARRVCLDTETSSLESRNPEGLVGVSLSCDEKKGFYIPVRHQAADEQNRNCPLAQVLELIRALIENGTELIFQNAKFDWHVLKSAGLPVEKIKNYQDTMVLSYCQDPTENHGMDSLSVKYLGGYQPQSFKEVLGEQKNFSQVPVEKALFYSAEDSVITLRLWNVFAETPGTHQKIYEIIDRPLVRVLWKMEHRGVEIDTQRLRVLSEEFHKDLNAIESRARESLSASGIAVSQEFNLHSTKQMAEILYTQLKLPIKKKNKSGPSTDVSALEDLEHLHPFPKILMEYREVSKLLSTYIDSFPTLVDPRDQRLHTDFSQTLTVTGRLSSSHPNLQNIPIRTARGRKMREAFYTTGDRILVGADYSQIELRLLAIMSRDAVLLQAFDEDADIHKRTAALILGKNEASISNEERQMAKAINFGIVYGQTAFGLSRQLGISRTEAQRFIDSYFSTYPGIAEFSYQAVQKAKSEKSVVTFIGRRRPLPELESSNTALRLFAERSALNSPLQGTAADLIKMAMVQIDREMEENFRESSMLLQVHDELLFETTPSRRADLVDLIKSKMENRNIFKDFGVESFPISLKVEVGSGRHWGEI